MPLNPDGKPIFVIAGQSNAMFLGQRQIMEGILAQNGIDAQVVYTAEGDTTLRPHPGSRKDWYPFDDGDAGTGQMLEDLYANVDAKLAEDPENYIAGLFWIHGESDSRYGASSTYAENLTKLYEVLSARWAALDMTLLQISENLGFYNHFIAHSGPISEIQKNFAETTEGVEWFDPDDAILEVFETIGTGVADFFHFSNLGYEAIAYKYLQRYYDDLLYSYDQISADGALKTSNTFSDGQLASVEQTDIGGVETWSSILNLYAANGAVKSSQISYDDGSSTFTEYDQPNRSPWERIDSNLDSQGQLVDTYALFDDGREKVITYSGGANWREAHRNKQLVFAEITDSRDAHDWHKLTEHFASNGELKSKRLWLDDGTSILTEYDQPNRSSWTRIDGNFDSQGQIIDTYALFDDGREKVITYSGGSSWQEAHRNKQLVFAEITDSHDAHDWHKLTEHFASNGELKSKRLWLDDGTSTLTEYDQPNHSSWTKIDGNFDSKGQIIDTYALFDDGREKIITYSGGRSWQEAIATGKMLEAITQDTDDAYDWLSITESFNTDRERTSLHIIYDDGSEIYEGPTVLGEASYLI